MKLRSLNFEGFRGALNPVRVQFGEAFTVVTGRNGAGKSTIVDAIEYALTGTLERFQFDTEKGEHIEDYLWWRGAGSPRSRIVTLVFVDESGRDIAISRGPDSNSDRGDIQRLLIDASAAPDAALSRLCQTAIIRDESIIRLSTDMGETDRFEFVNRIMGLSRFDIEGRLSATSRRLREMNAERRADYERTKEEVSRITSELSQARLAASGSGGVDLAAVIASLSQLLNLSSTDVNTIVSAGRNRISVLRAEVDEAERIATGLREADPDLPGQAALKRQIEVQRKRMEEVNEAFRASETKLSELSRGLELERAKSPTTEALAQLREQGVRLGLQAGECPLCGLPISEEKFHAHIQQIEQKLDALSSGIASLTTDYIDAKSARDQLRSERDRLDRTLKEFVSLSEIADSQFKNLKARASQLRLESREEFKNFTELRRQQIQVLENDLSVIQSSLALERVTSLERQLSLAREKLTIADSEVSRISKAEDAAKETEAAIKRVTAEIVDERLADISPLLSELYFRLRPHSEWSEIQYLMRGDVRRFLSFNVGPDLNPRFVFSSGQRRALGLAFLLAVHLSRQWCKLRTLLLDDPVQHIDDFRAMHLVEVLAAIGRTGRQVVCSIEDSALADLMCRRFQTRSAGDGAKVEMSFENGKGISAKQSYVVPLATHALLSA